MRATAGALSSTSAPVAEAQPVVAAPVVLARDLAKRFGATQALSGVGLEIRPGEIRALVGRNGAGKSTLVSLLTGLVVPDMGEILFQGVPAPRPSEPEVWQTRVACVYQHPKLVPTLSCAENLFLSDCMRQRKLVSWSRMRREAREVLEQWGVDIDVEMSAGALSVGQRQLLEIARALMRGSRFVILDEPTARLNGKEVQRLFSQIRLLQLKGVGTLFISHHLEEIFSLCQSVTVLRDGQKTWEGSIAEVTRGELVDAMVGPRGRVGGVLPRGTVSDSFDQVGGLAPMAGVPSNVAVTDSPVRPALLEIQNLSCRGLFEDVSFRVAAGECVGIAGLAGSGKEALGEALAGLRSWGAGAVRVGESELPGGDVATHNRAGIGFVPQDRHREGLVLGLSVAENVTLAVPDRLGSLGFILPPARERLAARMIRALGIKTASSGEPVSALSGGNQQKVVLARALAREPRVLVLIQPTSGVDVASKAALLGCIREVASSGAAIVMISDELDEFELCDRVLVIRAGRITRELVRPFSQREIVAEIEGVSL
jgi:simple sugar transport system ATP-binding protein